MTELAATATLAFREPTTTGFRPMRWRARVLLTLLVLGTHAWLLTSAPSRISPATGPVLPPALETRRIELPPPAPAVVTPEPLTVEAAPQPASKPVLKPKRPLAQVKRAPAAPELIAQPEPPPTAPIPPDTGLNATAPPGPPAAAIPDSDAANAAADAIAAAAAVAAANKPVAAAPATPASAAVPALPETTAVTAMALPASAELKYKATGFAKGLNYQASTELAWYHDGSSYNTRMTMSAFLIGSLVWSSTGQITPEGLAPTRFAEKRRSEVAAHFEPDKGQIIFSANTPTAPWIKGAQDRATVFLQLAGMLAGNPAAFPPGSSISLYTVGPRSADLWTFVVESVEVVSLPAGDMPALKLTRKPRGEYDNKVELWLAPSLGYLPVRNKVTQPDGAFVDQQLSEAKTF